VRAMADAMVMSAAARRGRRLCGGRFSFGGAAAPGMTVRAVVMLVFGVVHPSAPALQPIPGRGI